MATFTELPEDVIHDLLCALPDFGTLSAAIRLSKSHTYDVFVAHRGAILYAVARNLVGPCLPQAVKVLRWSQGRPVDKSFSTDDIIIALRSFTRKERAAIEKSCDVDSELEALFSQM